MRVKIGRETWILEFVLASELSSRQNLGECDHPTARRPRISVRRNLEPKQLLEITTHELLHAVRPELSEESVQETAAVLARVLFRLGARLTPPN